MEFTSLNTLSVLIFLSLLLWLFYFWFKTFNNQIIFNKKFKLLSTNRFFYIKYIFLILSFIVVLFSVFWPKFWENKIQNQNKWIDMMFVLDVSKSMNVADINDSNHSYTRLDVIKDSISKFVVSHKQDRFWLIIFAWDAVSTIPLTIDHDLFLTFLQNVDYRNLTKQGSDFSKALSLWVGRFNISDDRSKAMIFISDWWDPEDNIDFDKIKSIGKQVKDIKYFVVWVWTKSWWRIITWRDVFGRYSFQKYKWAYVVSKINKSNLGNIVDALDWDYFDVSDIWDLSKLNGKVNKLEKKVINSGLSWDKEDFWRNLAIISFILYIFFLLLYIFENKFVLINKKLWKKV